MKILMLCDLYDESLQYQENLLAKYYIKNGHDVTVIAATFDSLFDYYADKYNKKRSRREYLDGKVKIIKLPYSLNFMNKLRRFGGVSKILFEEKPDLIYLHDIHLNIFETVKYVKKNPTCKIIMDYHSDYSNSAHNWVSLNILHKVIRKFILYRGLKYISKIYPIVPASAIFLHEVYEIPYDRMQLLPLGADTDLAQKTMQSKEGLSVREKYNIPEEDIIIFTGGKLTPRKKTENLIDAFQIISNPHLHLMIIGDASESDSNYKNMLLKKCDNNKRIHFIGWVDGNEIYKYMDACDLAVFPASQSVLWQQAISMGLPLIIGKAVRLNDGRIVNQDIDYLNLYGNIIILDEGDTNINELAKHILKYTEDKTQLNKIRESAFKTSSEILNYDKIILKTLNFNRL